MTDMLVKLGDASNPYVDRARRSGFAFRRCEPGDVTPLRDFVEREFTTRWADGIAISLSRLPIAAFVAVSDGQFVAFALYDCAYRGAFGPMGVGSDYRNRGIGASLLHLSLADMQTVGYAYAIISDVGPVEFYQKVCGAKVIAE